MRAYLITCALLASASSACTLFETVTFNGGRLDGSAPTDGATGDATDGATSCPRGRLDCDGRPDNGCETPEGVAACGAACVQCAAPNTIAACNNGRCEVGRCLQGFTDCDRDFANGCETRLSESRENCGSCGTRCAANQTCSESRCVDVCPAGQTLCGSACVDLQTDINHCGTCGTVCPVGPLATAVCAAGRCGVQCQHGYAECDGNTTNGCESLTSALHCGMCNRPCTGAATQCDWDVDTEQPRGGPMAPLCIANNGCSPRTACGMDCVDLTTSVMHCGRCFNACAYPNGFRNCVASMGSASCADRGVCNTGYLDCDGNQANGCETQASNPAHCGACNNNCNPPGTVGACVNTGGTYACQYSACAPGFANCVNVEDRLCETDVRSSMEHCGACNQRCSSTGANVRSATCSNSVCVLTCAPGFADCDGDRSNGCEAALNDVDTCGSCALSCTRFCDGMTGVEPTCVLRDGGSPTCTCRRGAG
ncbi:MAG: hypothetical protein U0269_06890 [Polyangiales bacterium]